MLKFILIALAIFVSLISLTTVGLAMTIKFWYQADDRYQKTGTCQVLTCNISSTVCDGQLCNIVRFNYALLNGTVVTPYQSYFSASFDDPDSASCPAINSTITCYYDDRNIIRTLSLDPLSAPLWATVVIAILITIIVLLTIIGIFVIYCRYSIYFDETYPLTPPPGKVA